MKPYDTYLVKFVEKLDYHMNYSFVGKDEWYKVTMD